MKKIRNYFVLMMVALFSVTAITSCNGDDDDDPDSPISNSAILGKWNLIHEHYYYKENGKILDEINGVPDYKEVVEFMSNGKMYSNMDGDILYGTYTLSGNTLHVQNVEVDNLVTVKKLTDSRLELEWIEKGGEGSNTYEEYQYTIYEKIK